MNKKITEETHFLRKEDKLKELSIFLKKEIKKCQKNLKKGYKWGKSGKCYSGRGALEKAKKQGRVIKRSQSKLKCC